MRIIGTQEEINWAMEALANGCDHCPYQNACEENARMDTAKNEKVHGRCKDFLAEYIQVEVSK
ncbi:hypothetical protein CE91St62_39720 [Lachnospiraceae bacterium]|uniref:2-ketoisovalerate ferredoxin oxidoreductase n=1 Tax=Extibacter sp. GGCC_0201 TaxID=2731209 RepID=UPI001AA0FB1C|nr:2-ketoisovalerate ferredoxin oxidoreductase [Extibacter sp. GGCC_0201]MBO1720669.1 2-ketoisovalerate ferredoxin oxidoreductase [Extibacter sp. GGCC_0201]BDF35911.1 hypothetical protein CE91St61_39860 [Lachnospiraceae bacterium]BDF39911.1 hypothetical protein CE91St62_39720 [Lachnospiraceae bacterium]